jgi:hypothetical protein
LEGRKASLKEQRSRASSRTLFEKKKNVLLFHSESLLVAESGEKRKTRCRNEFLFFSSSLQDNFSARGQMSILERHSQKLGTNYEYERREKER